MLSSVLLHMMYFLSVATTDVFIRTEGRETEIKKHYRSNDENYTYIFCVIMTVCYKIKFDTA